MGRSDYTNFTASSRTGHHPNDSCVSSCLFHRTFKSRLTHGWPNFHCEQVPMTSRSLVVCLDMDVVGVVRLSAILRMFQSLVYASPSVLVMLRCSRWKQSVSSILRTQLLADTVPIVNAKVNEFFDLLLSERHDRMQSYNTSISAERKSLWLE